MNLTPLAKLAAGSLAAFCTATVALADVIETKAGARLVGKVAAVDGVSVVLETDYAGTIKIKQSEVVTMSTEKPLFYRLSSGTVVNGTVAPTPDGKLEIRSADATVTTTVGNVASSWEPGSKDPALAALERKWTYQVGVDITGKTGNSEQLGTAVTAKAQMKTSQDTLQFYTAYNRQETDHVKSADQFKAGVDYANNFSGRKSWYVRDEGGFDRVKDIELYNVAAAGVGYDFIKKPNQTLTIRTGLSYRYEGYENPATTDVSSAGLDIGLNHELKFERGLLTNKLSYVPAFDDFGNYRATHESAFEMPITASLWKVSIGVANDYNSQPGVGVERLDTTYFTRLILNWQ